jgi:hypothetical protein
MIRVSAALALVLTTVALGCAVGARPPASVRSADAAPAARVYEVRTYTTHEGRLDALHQRFRNHTVRLLERHGMTNVGYWVPQDPALASTTLVYILAHPSRDAARQSWAAFVADPEWQEARRQSELSGPIVQRIESVFLDATDYSPLR